jgi:hypothetical protein
MSDKPIVRSPTASFAEAHKSELSPAIGRSRRCWTFTTPGSLKAQIPELPDQVTLRELYSDELLEIQSRTKNKGRVPMECLAESLYSVDGALINRSQMEGQSWTAKWPAKFSAMLMAAFNATHSTTPEEDEAFLGSQTESRI